MQGLTIGVYGLYLILVGINGNAGVLAGKIQEDAPKFLPWIIAIFVLAFVSSSSDAGRKVTGPFIALLVVAFVLKRFATLKQQSQQLWNMAAAAPAPGSANPAPVTVQSGGSANGISQPTFPGQFNGTSDLNNASAALSALEATFSS